MSRGRIPTLRGGNGILVLLVVLIVLGAPMASVQPATAASGTSISIDTIPDKEVVVGEPFDVHVSGQTDCYNPGGATLKIYETDTFSEEEIGSTSLSFSTLYESNGYFDTTITATQSDVGDGEMELEAEVVGECTLGDSARSSEHKKTIVEADATDPDPEFLGQYEGSFESSLTVRSHGTRYILDGETLEPTGDYREEINPGDQMTLTLYVKNTGGEAGEFSSIHTQFPKFDSAGDGSHIEIKTLEGPYSSTMKIAPGDTVYRQNGEPYPASSWQGEVNYAAWGGSSVQAFEITFTPQEAGDFPVLIRSTLTDDQAQAGRDNKFTEPESGVTDPDQGYETAELVIPITPIDSDDDGIPDKDDTCDNEPEDFDNYEDGDGCPENPSPSVSLANDGVKEGGSTTLSANADDPEGESLSYDWSLSGPGSLSGSGSSVTFDAPGDISSDTSSTVSVAVTEPDASKSDTDSATVSIQDVNHDPTANDLSVVTKEDTSVTKSFDASDPDGDSLSYSVSTSPSHGSVSVSGDSFEYTPERGYSGSDSFTYQVKDGNGGSDTATVSVSVSDVNHPPSATDVSVSTNEDTSVTNSFEASDPDGDSLRYSVSATPSHGSVTVSGDTFEYTPESGYSGSDSFTYHVSDGNGGSDTATVSISVSDVNQAPTANDVSISTSEGTSVTNSFDASDPDGDSLRYSVSFAPSHGSVTLSGDSFAYTPESGYSGSDAFVYRVEDGNGGSATAEVSISVSDVNHAPTANDVSLATNEATTTSGTFDASDQDGDSLQYAVSSSPAHGSATISGDSFEYTPTAEYSGSDSFTYQVTDGNGGSDTATVSISVENVNHDPTASDLTLSTNDTTAITESFDASDPDGDSLQYAVSSTPAHGSVTVNSDSFTYTPSSDFSGSDSFTYRVTDGNGGSASATVSVSVENANHQPTAGNLSLVTKEGERVTGSFDAEDQDGDPLEYEVSSWPAHGSVTVTGDSFAYTPREGYNGTDSFSYRVSDGRGASVTATVSISVQNVNHDPTARDLTATTAPETSISEVLEATDPDGDALSYSIQRSPSHGHVMLMYDTFEYTPEAGYAGNDTFTFEVSDGQGGIDTGTVTVTVLADNSPPEADFSWQPVRPEPGETVTLDATRSEDPDGNIATYRWDLNGDGNSERWGHSPAYTFDPDGEQSVSLIVVDDVGETDSETATIKPQTTTATTTPTPTTTTTTRTEPTPTTTATTTLPPTTTTTTRTEPTPTREPTPTTTPLTSTTPHPTETNTTASTTEDDLEEVTIPSEAPGFTPLTTLLVLMGGALLLGRGA